MSTVLGVDRFRDKRRIGDVGNSLSGMPMTVHYQDRPDVERLLASNAEILRATERASKRMAEMVKWPGFNTRENTK